MSELSPESRALIDAARDEHPPTDGRRRVKARVIAMAREARSPRSGARSPRRRSRVHVIAVAVGAVAGIAAVLAMILMRSPPAPMRRPPLEPLVALPVALVQAPTPPPPRQPVFVATQENPVVRPAAPHAQRRDAGTRGNADASAARDADAPPLIVPTQDAPAFGTLLLSTSPTSTCTVPGRETHTTPWRLILPAGHYAITCVNDTLSLRAVFSVTIVAGSVADFRNRPLE